MKQTAKPVRKCHSCLLNLSDHCWLYRYPRGQWRGSRRCPALGNQELYEQYRQWEKMPTVKTRRQLRQDFFRKKKRTQVRRAASTN